MKSNAFFNSLVSEVNVPKHKGMSLSEWKKRNRKEHIKKSERKKEKLRKYRKRIPKSYKVYIKSKWWTFRKNEYFQKHTRKCVICLSSKRIQLHHTFYANYGFEEDTDLIPFCYEHHQLYHSVENLKKNMREDTQRFIIEQQEILAFPQI